MLSAELKEKAKGLKGCELCNGDGTYIFLGCRIFCEKCHKQAGCEALWATVDSMLAKRLK